MDQFEVKIICNIYGTGETAVKALKDVSFSVPKGEYVAIVGESGSGKSTLLNMIGALDSPTSGKVLIDGKDIFSMNEGSLPIFRRRNIGFIFQAFNLIPELTVEQNMIFPVLLDYKKPDMAYLEELLTVLNLRERRNHLPSQLSGGQQQRVAIARTLAPEPTVLFMDEPLSNLDAKMRTELRDQIIRLHERLKTTFVYVTHDQAEAMQMGDRLAIMDMGRIVQTGTPQEIYDHPNSVYVAGFVGAPKINFFASHLRRGETGWSIRLLGKTLELPAQRLPLDTAGAEDGMRVILGVRPEDFRLDTSSEPMLQAEALNVLPMGAGLHVQLRCGEVRFLIVLTNHSGVQPGDTLALRVDPWNIQVFDAQTERNLCCPVRKEDAQ